MPLTPPRSASGRVYETWLNTSPSDEEYLDVAYDYIDKMAERAAASAARRRRDLAPDSTRARRLANAWKGERLTRRDLLGIERSTPEEIAELARRADESMRQRGAEMTRAEAMVYYH